MRENAVKFEMREAGPGRLVLTATGGLSWEDRELLAASVEEHFAGRDSIQGVVMDLARVEFVNSAGLGALFQLVQRLRQRGGTLALANVPPTLVRLFRAVGLARVARIGDSVESALDLLECSPPGPLCDIENQSNKS
ncbi:MAG: STAS domain-containing protein [Planctomycetes bacterium]|nr:STAS domain-containing protein [Planctomycetota bacterium]